MLKYKIQIIMLFLLGLISINFVYAKTNPYPLLGRIIYIDPGHGGLDPGAFYKNIKESDINLDLSFNLMKKLESLGAIVYMTRYGDYDLSVKYTNNRKRSDLSRRGNLINKSGADLYLSIHLNADRSSIWSGAQIFFDDVNIKNENLAKVIQNEFARNSGTKRKIKEVNDMYLNKRIKIPGVLVEAGFLSNPNDRYLLQKKWYQDKISKIISNGLIKYFKKRIF